MHLLLSHHVETTATTRRDEQQQANLATLEILEMMGILDCKMTRTITVEGSDWRQIYMYGDVLTIQKLHQLNPSVLTA